MLFRRSQYNHGISIYWWYGALSFLLKEREYTIGQAALKPTLCKEDSYTTLKNERLKESHILHP